MTTNHIDQLAEWWETAAPIDEAVDPGTVIIGCMADGSYEIFTECDRNAPEDYAGGHTDYRILARAPKPKPAWHDAPAVTAKGREDWDHVEAFSRNDDYDPPRWIDNQGITYTAEQLSDVTPLIEAKVTDEARDRVWDELVYHGLIDPQKRRPSQGWTADVVHAALGLETE